MDIKVLDLDATIEMLKKDYAFGQQGKDATNAVKGVLMFSKVGSLIMQWKLSHQQLPLISQ
jgi:hypothetical protein